MLFNSYAFLFCFFPLTVLGYFALGRVQPRAAALFAALMSLVFYGGWNVAYVPLLLASITANYGVGRGIEAALRNGRPRRARAIAATGITADLLLLAYFKYANFLVENWNALSGGHAVLQQVVLPLGISFYTFTQIAFLVDTLQRRTQESSFVHYLLFVTYFPHLIAGPILHHKEMIPQFARRETYVPRLANLCCGSTLFFIGLFKKTVLADNLASFVAPVFNAAAAGQSLTAFEAWGGALAYTFQLYFDFSGYCDMAIGLSWILGVKLPLNFDSPYKALDIADFWRRWHMTLSRFLRDYLYIPLGGNRHGAVQRYRNLLITMLLGGLWHGAGWTFVVWGALHGAYLVIHQAWRGAFRWPVPRLAAGALTFVAVVFAWVFFRAPSIGAALSMVKAMLLGNGLVFPSGLAKLLPAPLTGGLSALGLRFGSTGEFFQSPQQIVWIAIGMAVCWGLPNSQQLLARWQPGTAPLPALTALTAPRIAWKPNAAWGVAVGVMAAAALMSMDRVSEFLYFQF